MKKIISSLVIFSLFIVVPAYGQITIGSEEKPEEYEIVKVDGNGKAGLRLPRLTINEKIELEKKLLISGSLTDYKESAKGLTIYNSTDEVIEFWNGTSWVQLGRASKFTNGLSIVGNNAQLGGKLTKPSTIELEGKKLEFNIKAQGKLSIGENKETFQATNSDISFGSATNPVALKIVGNNEEDLLSVDKTNTVTISASKDKLINVNSGEFSVSNAGTYIPTEGTLQYKDGNEWQDVGSSNLVLVSDAVGNANWERLAPSTRTVSFDILDRANLATFSVGEWTPLTSSLSLEKGIWLLMGRYLSYTSSYTHGTSTANGNFLSLLRVYGINNPEPNNETVFVGGITPEKKASQGAENMGAYASPFIVTYIEVTTDLPQNFRIDFFTNKQNTYLPYKSSWLGEAYFKAVKIN